MTGDDLNEPYSSTAKPSTVNTPLSRKTCVVLVPVGTHVEPGCEAGLVELEKRGYVVRRVRGYSAIDQGRNQMATDALAQGFLETMWIDSDVAFNPDDVDQLRSHGLPLVCGIYPKKGKRELSVHVMPGTQKIVFGSGGGLIELKYAATGFLLVQRSVYERMQIRLELPVCNQKFGSPMVPFFQPLIINEPQGPWYLAEDFAFSERARQCDFHVMADTTVRLFHVGSYPFSWEEAGLDPRRFASFEFHLS